MRKKLGTCRDPSSPPMTSGVHLYPDQLHPYPPRGHLVCTSIRINSIRTPKRTRGAHLYSDPLGGGGHTALSNIILGWYPILFGFIVWIIDCKEQALLSHPRQPVTAHVSSPAERKDKSDDKSLPTISDSRLQGDDDSAITSGTSWQAKKSSHH